MPLHFEDLDVITEAKSSSSALIVPCYMCPAATLAERENKPFLKLLNGFLKSAAFAEYISGLQDRLQEQGVPSKVFKSTLPNQWFLCMWTAARQKKLEEHARRYETVIVLGCESATKTVLDSIKTTDCKLIEGMKATGIMNTKLSLRFPCDICFEDSKVVPLSTNVKTVQTNSRTRSPTSVANFKRDTPGFLRTTS